MNYLSFKNNQIRKILAQCFNYFVFFTTWPPFHQKHFFLNFGKSGWSFEEES